MTFGMHKWVDVLPSERAALRLGFAFHFCVLASYYLVRPLRDALGLDGGADKLQWLFSATFVVMLLMVPLFGALVSRMPAARFIPLIYRLVALTMLIFGLDRKSTRLNSSNTCISYAVLCLKKKNKHSHKGPTLGRSAWLARIST